MPNALMPDTSSYDDPTGNALLAKGYDPTAASRGAIDVAQGAMNLGLSAQVMKLRDAQIGQEQLALGRQRLQALNGVLGALVTNPTPGNFTSQVGWAVQNGVIDPTSASKASQEVTALGGDPAKIKQWATDHLNQNAQHEQLMDQAYGKPGMLSDGAVSSPTMVRGGAGGGYYPAAGPNVVQQMGPGEAASQVAASPDPATGAPRVQSKGAYAASQGRSATVDPFGRIAYGGPAARPAAPPPNAGAAPGQAPAQGGAPAAPAPSGIIGPNDRVPDSLYQTALRVVGQAANADPRRMTLEQQRAVTRAQELVDQYQKQNSGGPVGAPAAPATPGPTAPQRTADGSGPMVVGLPPGAVTSAEANASADAAQGQALQRAADAVPQTKATIGNLETDLNSISTGPLASRLNVAKATYNQVAGMAGLPQIDPGGIAKMEQFHKNASILAAQQFAALGGTGTDQQLGAAVSANPNEALSTMGNKSILALLKGNQDAIQAKNTAWQHRPAGQTYGQFAEDWNRSFSPRAFQMVYMNPQDRAETMASMTPQERAAVKGAIATAVQRGWIDPSKVVR